MPDILYIDDDKLFAMPLIMGLEVFGFKVRFENNADEAAELIREQKHHYDAIVLDIMLRRGSLVATRGETQTGYILYQLIRELYNDLPIIVVSVLPHEDAPTSLCEDKKVKWVRKPVEYKQLASILKEAIK